MSDIKPKSEINCRSCKHSTETYQLENDSRWPPIQLFLQCTVPVSDELRAMMPACFYRDMAIFVGGREKDATEITYNDNLQDCPTWEPKE